MRPEQDDTQASELQCFHDLYNIYIGTKKGDKFWPCGHFWLFKYQSRDLLCEQSSTNPGYFLSGFKENQFQVIFTWKIWNIDKSNDCRVATFTNYDVRTQNEE